MIRTPAPWRKRLLLTGLALALGTAALGWMHTAQGRRALRAMGVPCPLDSVSAAQVVAGRERGLNALRGQHAAPMRPALGLALDQTTEAQALDWARTQELNCASLVRGLRYLRCRDVPAQAVGSEGPAISELWLSFGPSSTLSGLNVYRRGLSAAAMESVWRHATGQLRSQLGTPYAQSGEASGASLARSDLATARVQYRYSDYLATVTAAHMAYAGLSVREQYLSARQQN